MDRPGKNPAALMKHQGGFLHSPVGALWKKYRHGGPKAQKNLPSGNYKRWQVFLFK